MLNDRPICGLVLVDKPIGMTSHQVVSLFRKALPKNTTVGHLGTLDPFASGLLPILLGGATRLSDQLMGNEKQYLFTIQLGTETDTLDPSGKIIATEHVPMDFKNHISSVLKLFENEIEQIPPVYSALKMEGRPLYEHMRATGHIPQAIETKKRTVNIFSIQLIDCKEEQRQITIRTRCSKGTYVRSLARDIAKKLGTVGHCSALRREAVAPWHVDHAFLFNKDICQNADDLLKNLIPVEDMLPHLSRLVLNPVDEKLFQFGNVVTIAIDGPQMDVISPEAFVYNSSKTTLFYCEIDHLENKMIKIKPKKKMH